MSNIKTPIENWTHVDMKLFTRNGPYYHLLKYLIPSETLCIRIIIWVQNLNK
jgi:hypothetical protein